MPHISVNLVEVNLQRKKLPKVSKDRRSSKVMTYYHVKENLYVDDRGRFFRKGPYEILGTHAIKAAEFVPTEERMDLNAIRTHQASDPSSPSEHLAPQPA